LQQTLKGSEPGLQRAALRGLGEHHVAEARPEITALLADPKADADTRDAAAAALGEFPADQVQAPLVQALSDPAAKVRSAALRALGATQAKGAATAVAGTLQDSDDDVRAAAAATLGILGGPPEAPRLVQALLQEKKEGPARAQVRALVRVRYRDLSVFPQLVERLRSVPPEARPSVARLLAHLSGQDFTPGSGKPQQVEESIAKWTDWWKKSGQQR